MFRYIGQEAFFYESTGGSNAISLSFPIAWTEKDMVSDYLSDYLILSGYLILSDYLSDYY